MRAPSCPRRPVVNAIQGMVEAGQGGSPLCLRDRVIVSLFCFVLGSVLYGALIGTLKLCVLLSPGASAADPVAVRQSQTASAEAAAGLTYQAVQ